MPYYPTKADGKAGQNHGYEISSYWEKLVADYAGITLAEVEELDFVEWLRLRRDAFIARCMETEAGQKYLDNAWRMDQVEPDRDSLRKRFGNERR